jgi:hypothetical protein
MTIRLALLFTVLNGRKVHAQEQQQVDHNSSSRQEELCFFACQLLANDIIYIIIDNGEYMVSLPDKEMIAWRAKKITFNINYDRLSSAPKNNQSATSTCKLAE